MNVTDNYFRHFLTKGNEKLFSFPSYQGNNETISLASEWLDLPPSVFPSIVDIVTCSSGNQALSCILQVLRQDNSIIITEPFTYPAFKTIALSCGYLLKPCECDDDGITLDGLENFRLMRLENNLKPMFSVWSECVRWFYLECEKKAADVLSTSVRSAAISPRRARARITPASMRSRLFQTACEWRSNRSALRFHSSNRAVSERISSNKQTSLIRRR